MCTILWPSMHSAHRKPVWLSAQSAVWSPHPTVALPSEGGFVAAHEPRLTHEGHVARCTWVRSRSGFISSSGSSTRIHSSSIVQMEVFARPPPGQTCSDSQDTGCSGSYKPKMCESLSSVEQSSQASTVVLSRLRLEYVPVGHTQAVPSALTTVPGCSTAHILQVRSLSGTCPEGHF